MSRKSARVAAQPPPKKVVDDEEDDVEEEEAEEKPKGKKRAPPKSPAKGKGKKKADPEDEEDDAAEDEGEEGDSKKAKVASLDTSNALTTLSACLDAAKGSKSLREILTITPSVDSSSSSSASSVKDLVADGFEVHFDGIADALLNRSVLFIGGLPHRLLEIEFYCNGHQHIDLFAHGHERQKRLAEWYFHMTGKGYKGGSYKGLDVTFGDGEFYGGILLRSLQPLYGNFAAIEGPSLLVDHVLRTTNASGIDSLVKSFDMSADLKDETKTDHPLFFVHFDKEKDLEKVGLKLATVYKGARVGLSMVTFATGKENYVGKFYRYMINPDKIKKGRHYFVVSLYQQGYTPQQIMDITKSNKSSVDKLIALFNKGAAGKFSAFCNRKVTNNEVCEMLGACSTYCYPKKA